mmetsp:Transcript_19458/g.21466  ORF Transcript_19458/g.21466 Transcript_19458/m.21466 type:complete len:116 (-) Transcript_19458:40-387(-)
MILRQVLCRQELDDCHFIKKSVSCFNYVLYNTMICYAAHILTLILFSLLSFSGERERDFMTQDFDGSRDFDMNRLDDQSEIDIHTMTNVCLTHLLIETLQWLSYFFQSTVFVCQI